MTFDFLFDTTGVIKDASPLSLGMLNPLAKPKSVAKEIDDFKQSIMDYQPDLHRPYFLKIIWGTLLFKCVLTNLDIEFKLFKPDGTPVRAVAKCTFKGTVKEAFRKKKKTSKARM